MKKFLILITVVLVATCLVAGCVAVKTYTDSGQAIGIGVNQEFVIALGSNPTTGYDWEVSLDETILELVEKTYKPEKTEQNVVGAGGVDYFRFKALKAGETEITIVYKRSWEEEVIDQKVFTVNID